MMAARALSSSPSILPLYARAAASMIPGASRLPFVPGGSKEIPDLALTLGGVRADPDKVAAYAKVCGFSLRDHLPPTYPHVLAFPLHMAIMADGRFPFSAVGLVHVENRILQQRPIAIGEEMEIRVRATKLQPHPRGRSFTLISDVIVDEQQAWRGISTILRRGRGVSEPAPSAPTPSAPAPSEPAPGTPAPSAPAPSEPAPSAPTPGTPAAAGELQTTAEWRLGGDLGRRYAAVSGDRNPIHMHPLTARPLGFPGAIAHGMWTKARCLAALENRLPGAFSVEVRFRKPIVLPARVELASAQRGERIEFAVRDAERHTPHLEGCAWALERQQTSDRRNPA